VDGMEIKQFFDGSEPDRPVGLPLLTENPLNISLPAQLSQTIFSKGFRDG
jgi:hypothetical protein